MHFIPTSGHSDEGDEGATLGEPEGSLPWVGSGMSAPGYGIVSAGKYRVVSSAREEGSGEQSLELMSFSQSAAYSILRILLMP